MVYGLLKTHRIEGKLFLHRSALLKVSPNSVEKTLAAFCMHLDVGVLLLVGAYNAFRKQEIIFISNFGASSDESHSVSLERDV